MPRLGWIDGGVAIARREVLVAVEPIRGSMKCIAARTRDGVDDATSGTPVFGRVTAGHDAKFLHGVRRDGSRDSREPTVLVPELIGGIDPVGEKGILSGNAAKAKPAACAVGNDSRGEQDERIDAAAVDGKPIDLGLTDDG